MKASRKETMEDKEKTVVTWVGTSTKSVKTTSMSAIRVDALAKLHTYAAWHIGAPAAITVALFSSGVNANAKNVALGFC